MFLKRKIRILICCLAVMGMFSVGILAQAAQCTHPRYKDNWDEYHHDFYNANGHYRMFGIKHECATCNYSYWTNLYSVKIGDHEWSLSYVNGEWVEGNVCESCGWKR